MRTMLRLAAVAVLLLLMASPALAQGRLIIIDPGQRLDEAAIRRAAQPLLDRDAEIAIYLVQSGGGEDAIERMIDDGLQRSDGIRRARAIVLYVALDQRFSAIYFGDDWNEALGTLDNYDAIRENELNPGLSAGDFTAGFVDALGAIEQSVVSPPDPGGGTNINIDPTPFVVGGIGVLAVGAGAAAVAGRRRATRARAAAEGQLKDAREAAGARIAALGRRFSDASEKARFDSVSYPPEEVRALAEAQQRAAAAFAQVQTRFDDIGEELERREKPTNEQLQAAAAAYGQLIGPIDEVDQALAAIEARRRELDDLARQAPEEIARAKKS